MIAALFLAGLLLSATVTAAAPPAPSRPLSVRWEQRAGLLRSLALSPEGENLLWLDWNGSGRCIDKSGRERWSRPLANVSRLVAGPGARLTAAYWPGSRIHAQVLLLGERGEVTYLLACDSPVLSLAISGDGQRVAAGTGSGGVYLLVRDGPRFTEQRIQAEGRVEQLFFGRTNGLCYVTAAPVGFGRIAAEGKLEWYSRVEPGRDLIVSVSPDGSWIAAAERPRLARREGSLTLWNGRGEREWSRPLAGWPTAVRVAQGATRILVGLERRSTVGQVTHNDRSLLCFTADGHRLWEKGGTFLEDPLFVAMERGGEWVVAIGRQYRFYLLGDQGELRWRESTRTPVQIAVGSADGSSIGVAYTDGRLAWLAIPRVPHQ